MDDNPSEDVTRLLVDWSNGDEDALKQLTPLVYDELHGLAQRYMRRERGNHTLQATALVHEAFVRLIDQKQIRWRNTLHFTALAAKMMRRILIDHARSRRFAKRGSGAPKVSLDDAPPIAADAAPDLLEVDEALERLSEADPQLARIVELRFFGGMKNEEIAELLEISVPTVTRRWRMAKAWLYRHLTDGDVNG
jgi:RNA polymerase sigma factor (TIGR02999 family)